MIWYLYTNSDGKNQMFFGVITIFAIIILIVMNLYFWIKEKIKN